MLRHFPVLHGKTSMHALIGIVIVKWLIGKGANCCLGSFHSQENPPPLPVEPGIHKTLKKHTRGRSDTGEGAQQMPCFKKFSD